MIFVIYATICPLDKLAESARIFLLTAASFIILDQPFLVGDSLSRLILQSVCLATCLLIATGCEKSPPPEFRLNAVEWVKQEQTHLEDGEHFDERYRTEIDTILTALFGTPDEPKFPFINDEDPAHQILTIDNLQMAAGAVRSDKRGLPAGLYREHCAHCHGITGDGAGSTAALLNPYPRDFRLGKFKFKSTPLRQPPPDHDLQKIIENGIPGTAMPSFRTLPAEEIESLIDYVKYLTMRGLFERYLLSELAGLDEEPLLDLSVLSSDAIPSPTSSELSQEQLIVLLGDELRERIIAKWIDPERKQTAIAPAPAEFDPTHRAHAQFVSRGRELFFAKGNCAQCHGETGSGDGQLSNFDDWTNDWIKAGNVDPHRPETYRMFTAAGALRPRTVRPRNLNLPGYRGGDRPSDLFLRLTNGIEGTPMPASTALTTDEIWALVAFVKSMPYVDRKTPAVDIAVRDKQVQK